jgi:peptidoglycan/xylan/chitin deacetylase (PgdA/CDA1 family)
MDWQEILYLREQGISFGSHTASHAALRSLSPFAIVTEAVRSRTAIEQQLGKPIQSIAYPWGQVTKSIGHLCGGVGYTIGLTCEERLSTLRDNPLYLPRLEVRGNERLVDFVAKLI